MTTLCRSDWIQAYGNVELELAKIDPLKLPTSSFEKIVASSPAVPLKSDDLFRINLKKECH
jgi:hypothetical protein